VPETDRTRQKRAEGLSGGAPKGCYGKCKNIFLDKKTVKKNNPAITNFDGPKLCI